MIIKRWNGTSFIEEYPKTTVGKIVASGSPGSTTFLRGDGTWAIPAVSSHTHGSITNTGAIAADTAIASGFKLVTTDGTGNIRRSNIAFGSNTTTYLRNDGTWVTPPNNTRLSHSSDLNLEFLTNGDTLVYNDITDEWDNTSLDNRILSLSPAGARPSDVASFKTGNYTLLLEDANKFIVMNASSNASLTIPTNTSVPFPIGTEVHIVHYYPTSTTSISPASGVTIVSEGNKRKINAQYQVVTIKKLGTNLWILFGALKS